MKEKAIYIGAVVLTAVWGVAAPEGFAPFLLGFELLLAFSMWILVQILAGRVEIVPEPGEETVGKQEPIVLRVKLKNASLLPASCVAVTVGWRDLLDNSTGTVESMGMAGGKLKGGQHMVYNSVRVHPHYPKKSGSAAAYRRNEIVF